MTGTADTSSWGRTPGWVKLLVILSLLGNLAVIGIAGGTMLGERREPREPGLSRTQSRLLQMVPEARRDEAREILLARGDEVESAREAMRTAQAEMLDALRADPFSPERFAAALAGRQAASLAFRGIGQEQLGEIASRLSASERAEMADRLEERYRRWAERRDGKR